MNTEDAWLMILIAWVVWIFDVVGNTWQKLNGGSLAIIVGLTLIVLCKQISVWSEGWGKKRRKK